MRGQRALSLLLVTPALLILLALFVYPLLYSLVTAFVDKRAAVTLANFTKSF